MRFKKTYICAVLIISVLSVTFNAIPTQASLPYANQDKLPINQEGMDDNFVRLHDYGGYVGKQYNPLFIANDAVLYFASYHNIPKGTVPHPEFKKAFFNVADWLQDNGIYNENGFFIPYMYDVHEYKAPWFSGITQARVATVFIRAYMWSGDETYLELAKDTLKPMGISLADGGFSYLENGLVFFEEYPIRNQNILPNHVLNAHMSIVLDMLYANKVLQDQEISKLINSGVETLKQVLPLYEIPSQMGYAGDMIPGTKLMEGQINGINGYLSYDLIHMKYLAELYQETQEPIFNKYFFRYYATIYLRKFFEDGNNVVSPVNEAFVESSSGFSEREPNRLEDAFRNYYVDPYIYAASTTIGKNYFVVNLNKSIRIKSINLKFHWDNYPTFFALEGYDMSKGIWVVLIKEVSNESLTCNYKLDSEIEVNKLRLVAYDYNGQQRLLMDKFIVKPLLDKEKTVELWAKYTSSRKLEFLHIDKVMEQWLKNEALTIEETNKDLIEKFSEVYQQKYSSIEFWELLWERNKAEGSFYLIDPEGYGFNFNDLDPAMEMIKK